MIIRVARPSDAGEACDVLRASISELCAADHRQIPEIMGRWLANKTPGNVAAWADGVGRSLLIAVDADTVLAVGGVTDAGEITLNYVAPRARFRGVSDALLGALEARAIERGAARVSLFSTTTAHRFYLSRGYRDAGAPQEKFGMTSYPMAKELGSEER